MTNIIAICCGCITGSAFIALIGFGSIIFALIVALIGSIIIFITDLR